MRAGIQLLGQAVVDAATGHSLGSVADLLFDDEGRRVTGLVVERRRLLSRPRVVPFERIHAFDRDAIVATSCHVAGQRASDLPSAGALEGRPIVTAGGRLLGTLRDVYFDEHTGRVMAYEVSSLAPRRICRRRRVLYLHSQPIVGDIIILARRPARAHGRKVEPGERQRIQ
jgi:uncharacterized protein YrrD